MRVDQDRVICPLTGKVITFDICFDISMVMEGLAPKYTIGDDEDLYDVDKHSEKCLACEHHPK